MHSIKLEYDLALGERQNSEGSGKPLVLEEYLREYNKLKRIAYNKFVDETTLVETTRHISKNIETFLDRSWVGAAVLDAQALYESRRKLEKPLDIVFGGKENFLKLARGKISKEEWLEKRNPSLKFNGSKHDPCGNRKFKLDAKNSQIIFQPSRGIKFKLKIQASGKQKEFLEKLEFLAKNHEIPLSYCLKRGSISISVDETREALASDKWGSVENRILSLDLNPNYIAVAVCDYNGEKQNEVHAQVYSLVRSNQIGSTNKRKYEVLQISKSIFELAKHYNVETLAVEKLSIDKKNHGKGRRFNRLVNNLWNKKVLVNNLKKRCGFAQLRFQEIVPEYSSFVGCIMNPEKTDSVAAALEIGRRANLFVRIYHKKEFSPGKNIVFPRWNKHLANRWKEELGSRVISDWKDFYQWFKENPRFSYRVLFPDFVKKTKPRLFRHQSTKSNILVCFC